MSDCKSDLNIDRVDSRKIVWLASYPKSGNTWVRLLLGNLLGLGEEIDDEDSFSPVSGISSARRKFENLLGVNTFDLSDDEIDRMRPDVYRALAARSDEMSFIKAHDAYTNNSDAQPIFPTDATRAAIYMVRDPMDVAISYSYHRGETSHAKTVKMMNDSENALAGGRKEQLRQFMGSWSDHYQSWTRQTDIPVLVVRYEDLRADTAGKLTEIVGFAGLDPSRFAMTIEEAVQASRFDRLQEIEARKGFREKPVKSQRFFRSGRSGEGREQLPEQLQKELIAHHSDVMRELGYIEGTSS